MKSKPESRFKKEIIDALYGSAMANKPEGIITLAEIEYPEECDAKNEILKSLKKEKIITKS